VRSSLSCGKHFLVHLLRTAESGDSRKKNANQNGPHLLSAFYFKKPWSKGVGYSQGLGSQGERTRRKSARKKFTEKGGPVSVVDNCRWLISGQRQRPNFLDAEGKG